MATSFLFAAGTLVSTRANAVEDSGITNSDKEVSGLSAEAGSQQVFIEQFAALVQDYTEPWYREVKQ